MHLTRVGSTRFSASAPGSVKLFLTPTSSWLLLRKSAVPRTHPVYLSQVYYLCFVSRVTELRRRVHLTLHPTISLGKGLCAAVRHSILVRRSRNLTSVAAFLTSIKLGPHTVTSIDTQTPTFFICEIGAFYYSVYRSNFTTVASSPRLSSYFTKSRQRSGISYAITNKHNYTVRPNHYNIIVFATNQAYRLDKYWVTECSSPFIQISIHSMRS